MQHLMRSNSALFSHMLCIIIYILLHPILRFLPSQFDKLVFKNLVIPSAHRSVGKTELRVYGDKLHAERAIVIANHLNFYDFLVLLAIACNVKVEIRFYLLNRLVRFPTITTLWQYPTTQKSINSAPDNCWVVVFPEQQIFSSLQHTKEQSESKLLGSKIYTNLLVPDFSAISLQFDVIYDFTIIYKLKSGLQTQVPRLDNDHYCGVFVKRIDTQLIRDLKPKNQHKFLLKLWEKKDQHLSKLTQ